MPFTSGEEGDFVFVESIDVGNVDDMTLVHWLGPLPTVITEVEKSGPLLTGYYRGFVCDRLNPKGGSVVVESGLDRLSY